MRSPSVEFVSEGIDRVVERVEVIMGEVSAGEKKAELGCHRASDVVAAELSMGFGKLRELVGGRFLPVLVPPWSRIDQDLLLNLSRAGFRGLSTYGPRSAPANAIVEPNRADFGSLLSRARVSVSQAGYNTVTDLLAAGVPAVLVPFSAEGEREKSIRARVLAEAGIARVLTEDCLNPEALLDAVRSAAATVPPRRRVWLDGAGESADAILEIARSAPAAAGS